MINLACYLSCTFKLQCFMFVHYVLFISPFSSLFSNSLRCLEVKMHDTSLPACIAKFQCHIRRSELFPQSIRQYVPFHFKTTFLVKHGLEKFLITVKQNAKSGLTSTVEPPLIALSRGTGKCPLNAVDCLIAVRHGLA